MLLLVQCFVVVNRPLLGFSMIVATRPDAPPTKWTDEAPAISSAPIYSIQNRCDSVMIWKRFPHIWTVVRGIHQWPDALRCMWRHVNDIINLYMRNCLICWIRLHCRIYIYIYIRVCMCIYIYIYIIYTYINHGLGSWRNLMIAQWRVKRGSRQRIMLPGIQRADEILHITPKLILNWQLSINGPTAVLCCWHVPYPI